MAASVNQGKTLSTNGKPRIVATYNYRDETGTLLYQVVRREPKDFRQRRPDGRGGWIPNLDGTLRVLYRLPELLKSHSEQTVFIVEGEKDVDNLLSVGAVATTNAGGANKWRPEYSDALKGRHVVILPDNDDPGRKHAQAVAQALDGVAASITILELPGLPLKGDVSDWLQTDGNDKVKLLQLALEAARKQDNARGNGEGPAAAGNADKPRFALPVRCSELQSAPEGVPWLWHGCLARGAVTLFSALWKSGKTTLLAHLLKALETEESFCGLPITPAKVLYVTEESEQRWAERRDQLQLGDHVRFLVRPFMVKPRCDDWHAFLAHLGGLLAHEPADLVILDTLSNLWPVRDENDAGQVQAALMPLHQLTTPHNCGLLMGHHVGKSDSGEARASRGSGALPAFADVILELRRFRGEDRQDRRRVITGYGRWDDVPGELVVELLPDGTGYRACGDRQEVAGRELRDALLGVLPTEPPGWSIDQITAGWRGDSTPTKARLLAELRGGIDRGEYQRLGNGKRNDPYTYSARVG